jgi:hypothetical protein
MTSDGAEFVAEPFFCSVRVAVDIPVQGLNQKEARAEVVAQFFGERKIELTVKLSTVQSRREESRGNLIEILGGKDADPGEIGRKVGQDGRDLSRGHAARAGGEDKADGIGAGIGGEQRVFEGRVAANFDPHGSQACSATVSGAGLRTSWRSALRAAPGSG